ncbi:TPA: hypothetical protein QFV62_001836 [Enterococcus faecium]
MIKVKNTHVEKIVYLLCVLTFSFYLNPNSKIQMYQIILYPLFFYVILKVVLTNTRINTKLLFFSYFYCVIFLYISIITILNGNVINIFAGIKNWFDPFIVVMMFNLLLNRNNDITFYEKIIKKIAKLVILLLCLNTIWSILTMVYGMHTINSYFWGADLALGSKANNMGRFSGIFIQPIEAGVIYSIGLILFWYLMDRNNKLNIFSLISLGLLFAGGILSVSKVFIFCGIPLFFFLTMFFLSPQKTSKVIIFVIFISTIVLYLMKVYWNGFDYFIRFFKPENNKSFLDLLTAGRFNGTDSQQFQMIKNLTWKEIIFGRGFGADTTYDSIIFYFLSVGGIVVLSIGIIYMLYLFTRAIKVNFTNKLDVFFLSVIILVILSSLGAPTFFLNRVNLLIFLLISLFQFYVNKGKGNLS